MKAYIKYLILFNVIIFSHLIYSCSPTTPINKGVFYNEMSKEPSITIYCNKVILYTGNSKQNSSLLIYKIEYCYDTLKKQIFISGFQAPMKKFKSSFELSFAELSESDLIKYKFFWQDPNDSLWQIIVKNNETLTRTML